MFTYPCDAGAVATVTIALRGSIRVGIDGNIHFEIEAKSEISRSVGADPADRSTKVFFTPFFRRYIRRGRNTTDSRGVKSDISSPAASGSDPMSN